MWADGAAAAELCKLAAVSRLILRQAGHMLRAFCYSTITNTACHDINRSGAGPSTVAVLAACNDICRENMPSSTAAVLAAGIDGAATGPQAVVLFQGGSHPDVGLVCQEMALLMERTKRLPQARDYLQRGLDIRAVSSSACC